MKKRMSLFLALMLLLTVSLARVQGEESLSAGNDSIALIVNSRAVTRSDLKAAATLSLFESALQCAGYGYGFDITDPLNIEDEMDKLIFDLESWMVAEDLAQSMGLCPLSEEAVSAAAEDAEAAWERYCDIARSDTGPAFLPAGTYQYVDNDPEGNIVRYFASFGLTKEALLQKALWEQTDREMKKTVTAPMTDLSGDDILYYYAEWFLDKMDGQYIVEYDEVIGQVIRELAHDPSEGQDDDSYESYERSILIDGCFYTLGDSTVRDLEQNGWTWTKTADGRFSFQITEEGNYFYAKTANGQPDGTLTMADLTEAYDISYEYLGFGFGTAFDPGMEPDIYTYMEEIYGADYTDDGVLYSRTDVRDGTLLIEIAEWSLRLTLE